MNRITGQVIVALGGLAAAAFVAASGHDGWGWILFATIVMIL